LNSDQAIERSAGSASGNGNISDFVCTSYLRVNIGFGRIENMTVQVLIEVVATKARVGQTEGVRTQQIDLGQFQPDLIDQIKAWSSTGELYALPYRNQLYALFYDKEEVKKRGIQVRDGMSWDDVVAISRSGNLIIGSGWESAIWGPMAKQYSLRYTNNGTSELNLNTDQWEQALRLWSDGEQY